MNRHLNNHSFFDFFDYLLFCQIWQNSFPIPWNFSIQFTNRMIRAIRTCHSIFIFIGIHLDLSIQNFLPK